MSETVTYAAAAMLLPPTSLALTALAGVIVARRRPKTGITIAVLSLVTLLVLSTFAVAYALMRSIEVPPLTDARASGAQAIVILGGGRNLGAIDWGGETVNNATLERVRYGARLARETALPILVTGGKPTGGERTEAELMRDVLQNEFRLPVRWAEAQSNTTRENAEFSAKLLKAAGVTRILLVTEAAHMNRSVPAFEQRGLEVIAAPTGHRGHRAFKLAHLIPDVEALRLSCHALREYLGILYYRVRT